ncbi:MAG: hypothetical protein Kow0092_26030 [Deferrisomatales bacterium]
MLTPMSKVRIAGPKDLLEAVVDAVGESGVVHLIEVPRRPGAREQGLLPCEEGAGARARREALKQRLRQAEEAAALLHVDLEAPAPPRRPGPPPDLEGDLEGLRELADRRKAIRDELAVAERYRTLCRAFAPVLTRLGELRRISWLGVTLDARYRDQVLPLLRERLTEVTGGAHQLLWRPLDEDTVGLLLLFPPSAAEAVGTLLSRENIQEIRLPRRYESLPLLEGLTAVEQVLQTLPRELEEVDRRLEALRRSYGQWLPAEHRRMRDALEATEVTRLFGATRYLFVIEGYAPRAALPELRARVEREFPEAVSVEEIPISPEERDQVPVAFGNPPWIRPFERLLSLLPPPRYGTLDPTPLVAMTFPLFFGVILGDVGYGGVLLALAWAVRRRWGATPLGRDLAVLVGAVAGFSVVFGFLYGELFGDLGEQLGLRPLWTHRMEAAAAVLALSLAVGVGHVLLGFVLGALQSFRQRLPSQGSAQLATVAALVAMLALLAALAQVLPRTSWRLAAAALVGAVVLLVYLEGPVSLVELLSAVGNILSYARLMALGLASAALALVANQLGGAVESAVLGAAVAVTLHALNLVLGLFSPTVHSLRLHYVEFLPRFYRYGGRAYRPFQKGDAR